MTKFKQGIIGLAISVLQESKWLFLSGECAAACYERYTAAYPSGDLLGYGDEQIEELRFCIAADEIS